MYQFSDIRNDFEFLGLNLGKLPNYVQYFGSDIVEGVAENWLEAEMSSMEVDGAGWRWVHGLVIPFANYKKENSIHISWENNLNLINHFMHIAEKQYEHRKTFKVCLAIFQLRVNAYTELYIFLSL